MKKAMDSFEQCFAVYPKMLSDYSNVPANSQVQIDQLNDVRIAYNFATPSRREYAITGYKTHESLKRLTDKFKLCKKSLETSVKKASDGDLTGSVEDLTKIAEINLQGDILEARNFLEKWKKLDLQEEIYTKLQSSLDKLTQTGTLAIKQTSASLAARALTAVQPQLALQTAENLRRMNGFNELGQYYSFCSSANLELNDLNAAQESALKSLKEKEDVDTRVLLSEIYEAKKLYPEAIEIYEKLTVAVPESERWYGLFHLARLYALAGQIAKAKELGSKADQSFDLDKSTGPKNDYAWVSGRYYAAIGDYAEALVKLSEAIAYMRKFDWFKSACAQLDRAYCYSKLGKAKQAEIDVKKVEKYFPESPYL